jgi:hypothetical protein
MLYEIHKISLDHPDDVVGTVEASNLKEAMQLFLGEKPDYEVLNDGSYRKYHYDGTGPWYPHYQAKLREVVWQTEYWGYEAYINNIKLVVFKDVNWDWVWEISYTTPLGNLWLCRGKTSDTTESKNKAVNAAKELSALVRG